jgi:hypothetical protein
MILRSQFSVESSWNVMAHGDAREGKWRGNWPMQWVASTLHTTSEHGVSSITTADAHTSAASSRLNWRPSRFKWTLPFRRKTKPGFCACAITFQTQSTTDIRQYTALSFGTLWITLYTCIPRARYSSHAFCGLSHYHQANTRTHQVWRRSLPFTSSPSFFTANPASVAT